MSLVHLLALLLTIQGSLATSDSLSWTGWYKESSSITEISTFSFSSNRKSSDSDAQKGGKDDDVPLGYFVLESSILPASNSSFLYAGNNSSSSGSSNSLLLLMCPLDFWLNVVKMPISAPSTCILDTPYRRKLYQSCPIVQWMSEFEDPSSSSSSSGNTNSSSSSSGNNSTIHSNNSTGTSTKRRFQKRQYPSDDFFDSSDNNYDDDAWDDDGIDNLYNTFEYLKMFVIYENDTVSQPTRIRNLIDKVYAKADTFYIFAIAYCGQEKFLASSPARRSSSSSSSKSTTSTNAASNASLLLNSIDVTLTVRRLVSLELGRSYTIDEHRGTEVVNTGSLYESSEFASFEHKILSIYRAAVIAGIVLFLASVAFYLSFLVREKWRNPDRSLFSLIAVQFSNSISLLALLTINNLITLVIVSEYESSNHSLFDSRNLSFSRQSTLFYPEQPNRSFLLLRDSLDWILSSILIYLVPSLFFKYVPIYRPLTSLSPGEWRSISGASMFTAWVAFLRLGDDFRMTNIYAYGIMHVWFGMYHCIHNGWLHCRKLHTQFEKMWRRVVREVPAMGSNLDMKKKLQQDMTGQIQGYMWLVGGLYLVFVFVPLTMVLPGVEVAYYFGYKRNNFTMAVMVAYQLLGWCCIFVLVMLKVLPIQRNNTRQITPGVVQPPPQPAAAPVAEAT